jgi:hypothetical protein
MVRAAAALACATLGLVATPLAAQQRSTLVVIVLSSVSQDPLPGAVVRVTLPTGRDTTIVTDPSGRYTFRRLSPGAYVLQAQWRDLTSHEALIRLADREEVEVEFAVGALQPAVRMPEIGVEAPREHTWLSGFDDRRLKGLGQYMTRDQLEAHPGRSLEVVLRQFHGLSVRCAVGGCMPYFARNPQRMARPQGEICFPAYYIDESPVEGHVLISLHRDEVEAIEVYSGMSQIPLELRPDPREARCGAIFVWSRRPGARRPPR